MTRKPKGLVVSPFSNVENLHSPAAQVLERAEYAPGLMDQVILRSPVGVAVIDQDGVLRNVNPSYCLIYGYRQDELLGRSFTILFPPCERERVMALHRECIDRGCEMDGEWQVLRRDGAVLNVLTRSVRVPGR